jgi:hypothetical protein
MDATDAADSLDAADDEVAPDAPPDAETEETVVTCNPPTGGILYVHPTLGSNSSTGSGMAGGVLNPACAFKTISHAVGVALPVASIEIRVLGPSEPSAATGEVFPIALPSNRTITSSGGIVTVRVPNAATAGFRASNAANAALRYLVIDRAATGTINAAQTGIAVVGTSTVTLTGMTIRNMGGTGIAVADTATVTVQAGTSSNNNGAAHGADTGHGMAIAQNGRAVVSGAGSEFGIAFNGNWSQGIVVTQGGSLQVTGTPGTGGAGSVTTNNNGGSGVLFHQPGSSSTIAESSIDGLVSWSNAVDGIRIAAEAVVRVRNCYLLANTGSGVSVLGDTTHWSVARINLGTLGMMIPDPGRNTLQSTGGAHNRGAGVCLNTGPNPSGIPRNVLAAAGNIFAGPTDCWTYMPPFPTLTLNATCTGAVDVGIVVDHTGVDVSNCGLP